MVEMNQNTALECMYVRPAVLKKSLKIIQMMAQNGVSTSKKLKPLNCPKFWPERIHKNYTVSTMRFCLERGSPCRTLTKRLFRTKSEMKNFSGQTLTAPLFLLLAMRITRWEIYIPGEMTNVHGVTVDEYSQAGSQCKLVCLILVDS